MEYMGHGEREETKNRQHILYRVIFVKQLWSRNKNEGHKWNKVNIYLAKKVNLSTLTTIWMVL
jgi:hypothetical protein